MVLSARNLTIMDGQLLHLTMKHLLILRDSISSSFLTIIRGIYLRKNYYSDINVLIAKIQLHGFINIKIYYVKAACVN